MNVAVIGLGVMGHGMAGRVLEHGHTLAVYNRTVERANDLKERGARVAGTPREAAEGAEVVVVMVSNDQALRDVAVGPNGFLAALEPNAVVLQMGTIGPDTTDWLNGEVMARGAAMVDGPVLGSKPEANEGKLWVLAGGDEETIARARPVLDNISQAVYHVGPVGQGTRLKLCSNLVSAGVVAALAEGIALLEAVGLDPQIYIPILRDTNLPSRVWTGKADLMARRDFVPRFSLDNMAKDVTLALALANSQGLDLQQGKATLASLERGAAVAGGDKDMAAAFEGVRRRKA